MPKKENSFGSPVAIERSAEFTDGTLKGPVVNNSSQDVWWNFAETQTLIELVPALVFVTEADGANTFTNRSFQQYTGLSADALLGDGWLGALHPDDRKRAAKTWRTSVFTQEPYEAEYRVRAADGEYRWHLVKSTAVQIDGEHVRWIGTCTDIDDQKRRELVNEEARSSEARFQSVSQSMFSFTGLLEPDGIVIEANNSALEFGGLMADDVIGRKFWDTHWWTVSADEQQRLASAVAAAAAGQFVRYIATIRATDDRLTQIDLTLKPIFDGAGKVLRIIFEGRDLIRGASGHAAAAWELEPPEFERAAERFRLLSNRVPFMIYAYHLKRKKNVWSNRTLIAALGYSGIDSAATEAPNIEALVHPEDLAAYAKHLDSLGRLAEGEVAQLCYRLRRADQTWLWLHTYEIALRRDASGRVLQTLGVAVDVSAQQPALDNERALNVDLSAEVAEIEALYAAAPIGLCVLDRDLRYVRINEAMAQINGVPAAEHLGRTIHDIIPELESQVADVVQRVLGGESEFGVEISGETPARPGVVRTWRSNWVPVLGSDAAVIAITVSAEEITEEKSRQLRQAFRLQLTEALQILTDPTAMLDAACALLGEHLGVAQVGFANTEADQAHIEVLHDWGDGRIPSVVGRWAMQDFGAHFARDLKAGQTIVVGDVREDARTNAPTALAAYEAINTRAILDRALIRDGCMRGMLFIHHCEPRDWTTHEVALVEEVTDRLWAALERAQAQANLRVREQQLRALFDHQFQFAAILSPDLKILAISRSALEAGANSADIVGKSFLDLSIWSQEVAQSWQEQFSEAHTNSRSSVREISYRPPAAPEDRCALNVVTAVRDDSDQLDYWVVESLDVTGLKRAENQARELGSTLRVAIDAVEALIFTWDIASNTVSRLHSREAELPASPQGPDTFESVIEVVHPEDRDLFRGNLEVSLTSDRPYRSEHRILRSDGSICWLNESGVVERGADGAPVRLTGISRDVTARKLNEEALSRQSDRQQQLLDISQALIGAQLDEAALASLVFEKIAGPLSADVCFNYRLDPASENLELVFQAGLPDDQCDAASRLELGQAFCGTVAATCRSLAADAGTIASEPQGAFVHALGVTAYACHPLTSSEGRMLGTFSLASTTRDAFTPEDISFLQTVSNMLAQSWERWAVERDLRISEEFNRSVTDGSVDCIKVLDLEGHLEAMNKPGQCLMEIDDFGSVCGKEWSQLWPEQTHEEIASGLARARAGQIYAFEAFCPTAKGTPKWWEVTVTPVRDRENGAIRRLLSVSRDITDRKEAEKHLEQRRTQLDLVSRTAQRLLHLREIDDDLLCSIFSDIAGVLGFETFYHFRPGAEPRTLQLCAWQGVSEEDRQRFATLGYGEQLCGKVADSRERLIIEDLQNSNAQGSEALVAGGATSYAGFPLTVNGELAGTIAFISRQHRHLRDGETTMIQTACEQIATALERAASEARFRSLANSIPALLFVTDAKGANTFVNQPFLDYSGLQFEDLLGNGWYSVIHPDDVDQAANAWGISARAGEPFHGEYRFGTAGDFRWHLVRALPIRDEHNRITEWVGTCIDHHDVVETREKLARSRRRIEQANAELEDRVKERTGELQRVNVRLVKEIEQRELTEAQLVQAQKLEALGQLTSGVAHDFNNVIAAIAGGFQIIERRCDDPNLREIARHGASAATRGGQMVKQLLAFARQQVLEPRAVDLTELLREAEPLLLRSVGQGVTIRVEQEPEIPPVRVDPVQLETALINLAVNARDAMPNGGKLSVSVFSCPGEARNRPPELGTADAVAITVSDDGPGIPPDVLQRVLEPFYTTKEPGKGTGLGLAMVHGFVSQSGGALRIESRVGKGTEVTIYLLVAGANDTALDGPSSDLNEQLPRGNGENILLVDDDDAVRAITAAQLADLGYKVIAASSGIEAIDMLERGEMADLVLTDVVMAGKDGIATVQALRERRMDLPVLFMTGHADRNRLEGEAVLDKPFFADALARAVAARLSTGSRVQAQTKKIS